MAEKITSEEVNKLKHLNTKNLRKYLAVNVLGTNDDLKMDDCSLTLYDLIDWAAKRIDYLEEENERMDNALEYVLESGSISTIEGTQKALWGLGSDVDNKEEIAALKPRFSS